MLRGEVDVAVLDLFATAEHAHEACLRLLEEGDHFDACEKAWAAVESATRALTLRWLGRAEPLWGTSWREFVASAFARAGAPEGEARELAAFFGEGEAPRRVLLRANFRRGRAHTPSTRGGEVLGESKGPPLVWGRPHPR